MTTRVYGRGRLTEEDHQQIERLAAEGHRATKISKLIKRHHATVNWYMYSRGLAAPGPAPEQPSSYMRGNRRVHRFTQLEDAFIQALRIQDYEPEEIAKHASRRFGTERSAHTIKCRLIMLGARDED